MPSLFSKIIAGDIPCEKIAEDERYFAFLDIRPINPGHTLVVPKLEVDYLFDLPETELGGILEFSRPVAKAIEAATNCRRVGMLVAGLEIPHAHLHLVPLAGEGELTFARAKPAEPAELARMAEAIRRHLT